MVRKYGIENLGYVFLNSVGKAAIVGKFQIHSGFLFLFFFFFFRGKNVIQKFSDLKFNNVSRITVIKKVVF